LDAINILAPLTPEQEAELIRLPMEIRIIGYDHFRQGPMVRTRRREVGVVLPHGAIAFPTQQGWKRQAKRLAWTRQA
jgi:hypothetical protein